LTHGADTGARNGVGGTPLHDAALAGHADFTALLLRLRADPNARESESGATPPYDAAATGHQDVATVLLAHGADPNLANNSGRTPAGAAAENGFPQLAAYLKNFGAR